MFPKLVGFPAKSSIFKKRSFPLCSPSILGENPYFWKTPKYPWGFHVWGSPTFNDGPSNNRRCLYLGVHRPVGAESFRVTTLGLRGVTRSPFREGRNRREKRRVEFTRGGQMLQKSGKRTSWGLENPPIFSIGFSCRNRWLALGFLNHQRFTEISSIHNSPTPNLHPPQKKDTHRKVWVDPYGFLPQGVFSSLSFRHRLFLVRSETLRFSRISMAGFLVDFPMASRNLWNINCFIGWLSVGRWTKSLHGKWLALTKTPSIH